MKEQYTMVRNKALACAIAFITHENYYTFDDNLNKGKKCYSFKRTKKFLYAMDKIAKLKQECDLMDN